MKTSCQRLVAAVAVVGLLPLSEPAVGQTAPGVGSLQKTLPGEREMRDTIGGFFTRLQAGEIAPAFNDLFKNSPQSEEPEVINGFVTQTEEIIKTFGAVTGHELIEVKRVGARLLHFTYLSYSDHYPLKWEIYCYLGKGGWQLLDFSVNKDLAGLFKTSGG